MEPLLINGVSIPRLLYGTAWKEDRTQSLVESALKEGFRGIDTANQRKHYHEAGVGMAIAAAVSSGLITRGDLFLQTKFTFLGGQDARLPYDPQAPIAVQVKQSFASSLEHLGLEVVDSYVLHGPTRRVGLAADDWAAWRAMEEIHDSGRARLLGVSNVSLDQLQQVCREARIRPHLVQNRCFAAVGWDRSVREYCDANGLLYQGFSLLTANRAELNQASMAEIAERSGRTIPQLVFRFAIQSGMLPLTGTTSVQHMRDDLAALEFELNADDMKRIETIGQRGM